MSTSLRPTTRSSKDGDEKGTLQYPLQDEKGTLQWYSKKLWPAAVIAIVFGIVKRILLRLLRSYGPADFRTASPKKQDRAMLYLFSCINAVVSCAPFFMELGLYWRNKSVLPSPYHNIDPHTGGIPEFPTEEQRRFEERRRRHTAIAVHTITGYLIHDLIAILPDAKEYASSVVHHVVTIIIGVSITLRIRQAYAHVPLFFLCELSTLALNLSWFIREFPQTATQAITASGFGALVRTLKGQPTWGPQECYKYVRDVVMPRTFAGSFTVVRVINFPISFWNAWNGPVTLRSEDDTRPPTPTRAMRIMMGDFGTTALGVVTALQFYWFALILKKVLA